MNADRFSFGAATRFAKRVRTALLKRLKGRDQSGNFVFEFRGAHGQPPVTMREVSDGLSTMFARWEGGTTIAATIRDAARDGAKSYVAQSESGDAICYLLVQTGASLDSWFIPLDDGDAVLYSIVTHPSARGQRLAGRLAVQVAELYVEAGNRALLDCAVWNISAHKAFEAAGFVRLREEPYPPLD